MLFPPFVVPPQPGIVHTTVSLHRPRASGPVLKTLPSPSKPFGEFVAVRNLEQWMPQFTSWQVQYSAREDHLPASGTGLGTLVDVPVPAENLRYGFATHKWELPPSVLSRGEPVYVRYRCLVAKPQPQPEVPDAPAAAAEAAYSSPWSTIAKYSPPGWRK